MLLVILLNLLLQDLHLDFGVSQFALTQESVEFVEFQKKQDAVLSDKKPVKKIEDGKESLGVQINADRAIVVDAHSGSILFEKNKDVIQPIASITKLMTALVLLDQGLAWDETIVYTQKFETVGAAPKIYRGEEITVKDSFYAGLISSDNNSIMALVDYVGLTKEEFVDKMNQKALELGLYNTSFSDPTGLDEYNTSTAYDVAKLIYVALQEDAIRKATILQQYEVSVLNSDEEQKRTLYNTDKLLSSYINTQYQIDGGKTGYIDEAGYCFTLKVSDGDKSIIVVVMNSDTINNRFYDAKVLTQWTFDNYIW